MNLHHQIKRHRNNLRISQEELAENIYVTRQTISNWETGKNYPDIHSLLLLSNFFGITLGKLVKGDLEIMKKKIEAVEIEKLRRLSKLLAGLLILMIVSAGPLFIYLKIQGIVIWLVISGITIFVAFKVEKIKKINDIQTYKEINAFMNGETLDNISKAKETGKKNYQKFVFALVLAILTFITVLLLVNLLEFIIK